MSYIYLIHPDESAAEKVSGEIKKAGLSVYHEPENVDLASRMIKQNPPSAVVIFLTSQSEEGMEIAEGLMKNRATADIPLVFVGGSAIVKGNAQRRFEDAYFVEEDELAGVLGFIVEG
jgi:DNA-binding response OmpR family regulator